MTEKKFIDEVNSGTRFEFGKNWASFLNSLTEQRIQVAKRSLTHMMSVNDLTGKMFLDIGCGSGIFSLASRMLLNAQVHSFDFDPDSVKCAQYLNEKYTNGDSSWIIEQGSILDIEYIQSLPKFDVVYSWGVLHHTGNMKEALHNASIPVKDNGLLFIAIYNDEGSKSQFWLKIKKIYNSSLIGKFVVKAYFYSYWTIYGFMLDIVMFKNPFNRYREYRKNRGMSVVHDWKDWLGGLPFEVATPEFIVDFYSGRGFILKKIKTSNSLGCNEFVFKKIEGYK